MKKITLIVLMLFTVLSYAQGEQLYADGTATDQDGNNFEFINYGTQDWAIEDAEVVTYRDGTPIPQVTDATEWLNLTTGAWCYYDNDPTKGKLYNWFAVTDSKNIAPQGWHIADTWEWDILENYLIDNGYSWDGSTLHDGIAKSMSSTTGWSQGSAAGAPGNDQSSNNRSGFNAFPNGNREGNNFGNVGMIATFWTTRSGQPTNARNVQITVGHPSIFSNRHYRQNGYPIRFIRDASTASVNEYNNAITIYPNPTDNTLFIKGNKNLMKVSVYNMLGKEVLSKMNTNNIDVNVLPKGVYIIKISDDVGQINRKFIKN